MKTTAILSLLVCLAFGGPAASDELQPNTWVKVDIDWTGVLAQHVEDGRWATGDGYSDNVLRTKRGEVLIRTGIESKSLGVRPGFYTNTTVAWDAATGQARVVEVANWGGGSSGHGKLLSSFAKHETPSPRHTYDGICYVPEEDAMYLMLGANWRIGGRGAEPLAKRQLQIDNESTWRYSFASNRWTRIGDSIRRFWPSPYKVSPYESHLVHWPKGKKLLFMNDNGNCYAEFDLVIERWSQVDLKNERPFRLYNARSTWDSRRDLWVFRLGPQLCTFDPSTKTFTRLPDCWDLPAVATREEKKMEPRWASKGICYIAKHDVYLVTGPTGNDTRVYDVAKKTWSSLAGGDLELVNGYCQYDPGTDFVLMNYQLNCFRLCYVP